MIYVGLYLKNRQLQNEACAEALGRDQPYAILSGIMAWNQTVYIL